VSSLDHIGHRGENIFRALITRFCYGRFYFHEVFLGEKHATTDFKVELINPTSAGAWFYVQVKSTTKGYTGAGDGRLLNVKVTKNEIEKLKKAPGPAYVVGIDSTGNGDSSERSPQARLQPFRVSQFVTRLDVRHSDPCGTK
jgi:hypothetical protein